MASSLGGLGDRSDGGGSLDVRDNGGRNGGGSLSFGAGRGGLSSRNNGGRLASRAVSDGRGARDDGLDVSAVDGQLGERDTREESNGGQREAHFD